MICIGVYRGTLNNAYWLLITLMNYFYNILYSISYCQQENDVMTGFLLLNNSQHQLLSKKLFAYMNHVCKHTLSLHVVLFSVWDLLLYIRCSIKYRVDTTSNLLCPTISQNLTNLLCQAISQNLSKFPTIQRKEKMNTIALEKQIFMQYIVVHFAHRTSSTAELAQHNVTSTWCHVNKKTLMTESCFWPDLLLG